MHLFADISSHGLGHLAIAAPILNALARTLPGVRLTIRSGLSYAKLRGRIDTPFDHLGAASDFGFVMQDAIRVDLTASAEAYRRAHTDWPRRVAEEAALLRALAPDLVLSNVSYLPLAGAVEAGIPAMAVCSLNWADLFGHHFGTTDWGHPIHGEMLAAYRSAGAFLRIMPGMPMAALGNVRVVGPVAAPGRRHDLPFAGDRTVLISMGGVATRLPLEDWPRIPGVRWLVPGEWDCRHPDAVAQEALGLPFADLLASADAVLTKPGYGIFVEAACAGVPVLFQRRENWPEQDSLIDWLRGNARAVELAPAQLLGGDIEDDLQSVWQQRRPERPRPTGNDEAAALIREHLLGNSV